MAHIPQDVYEIRRYRNFDIDTNQKKFTVPQSLPQRPAKFNTLGTEAVLTLNTFNVTQSPNRMVHQYDVSDPSPSFGVARY
jgi:eukaryotic translation initiation factor 2C